MCISLCRSINFTPFHQYLCNALFVLSAIEWTYGHHSWVSYCTITCKTSCLFIQYCNLFNLFKFIWNCCNDWGMSINVKSWFLTYVLNVWLLQKNGPRGADSCQDLMFDILVLNNWSVLVATWMIQLTKYLYAVWHLLLVVMGR